MIGKALFEKIFDSYRRLSEGKDIVVIEGTDYTSTIAAPDATLT